MNFIVGKVWPYVLNLPVIAAVALAVSLLLYGTSSRSDVCDAYKDVASELNSYTYFHNTSVNVSLDKLVRAAGNYSDDSDIQQDSKDLESIRDESYEVDEIVDATRHIASTCGISLVY
ncbi:hypothetical protein [Rhodococcus sp. IEGM 1379]|uniref:hypothetical protein n=1 Tax=Rhodococcus sp. IEGM 1379 TaxID=3047086 RepID=UPI0024B7D697|nr:hypothetical protein [Rhodococcus sp. IEGM 1379]MDI9914318.1 hypothetical protein [Rhodococcus sp. IEGM 1379]